MEVLARISSFEEDRFNRKKVADYITKIIENKDEIFNSDEGLVIGIDSAWGTGKTTFLDLWEKQLKEEDMYTIIRYNSWEDDDYDTPIIPISFKIAETFPSNSTQYKQKFLACINIIGTKIIKNVIEKKLGLGEENVNEIAKFLKDGDIELILDKVSSSEIANDYLTDYEMYKTIKTKIKKILEEKTESKKIIFLIDELDRCRPLYAISLLETIKHYFNIPNIIFVFALDMDQLKHSIATIYGQNMDSYGYIRRFFNHCIKLPTPDVKQYLNHINKNRLSEYPEFFDQLSSLFSDLNLTFRDIDVVYSNIYILYILKIKDKRIEHSREKFLFYSFLITLKYKRPELYEIITNEQFRYLDNKILAKKNNKEYTIVFTKEIFIDFLALFSNGRNEKLLDEYENDDNLRRNLESNVFIGININRSMSLISYVQTAMEGIEDISI